MEWPRSREDLIVAQQQLAAERPDPWQPGTEPLRVGGCFVCFGEGGEGPGSADDPGWAGAAVVADSQLLAGVSLTGKAGAQYRPGFLAMREGHLLEAVVRALPAAPDVLLVNATGRDHPRRCGLALHLGAVLDIPTVGVTHRPLFARTQGDWPADIAGATSPLLLDGEPVGLWVRTCAGTRPLVAHAAWRTGPETAAVVLTQACRGARTPEPIRHARRLAREARAAASG